MPRETRRVFRRGRMVRSENEDVAERIWLTAASWGRKRLETDRGIEALGGRAGRSMGPARQEPAGYPHRIMDASWLGCSETERIQRQGPLKHRVLANSERSVDGSST